MQVAADTLNQPKRNTKTQIANLTLILRTKNNTYALFK